jgi:membrane protein YqaA with SNARE-associated domain
MARSAREREESLRETQAGPVYDRLGPKVWILGGVMVLIGLVTTYLILQDFRSESYIYLAFYSIPANAAISFFPHEPVLIYFGKFANLWLAAAAATVGTVVAGYFLKYPFATLVVAGFTPIPFFPFKFLSFSIHYPLKKYLSALVVARYPRYFLLAWLGAVTDIPNWLLFAAFLLVINLYMIKALPALARKLREAVRRRGSPATVGGRSEPAGVEAAEAGP